MKYILQETTKEVWTLIHMSHQELIPFKAFNDIENGIMNSVYGFKHADYPTIKCKTTWDIDIEKPYNRRNQKDSYWLYAYVIDYDD